MKRLRPHGYRELLRTGRWFASIPDALQTALLDAAVVRTIAAEESVSHHRDPDGLFAVVDGAIRLSGRTDAGREVLHMVIEPPSWFGELAIVDGLPRTQELTADVETCVLHVPQPAIAALLDAVPAHWQHIATLVAYKLRLAVRALEDIVPPRVRLARRLAMLTDGYGDHTHARRTVELRQEQLAMMINLSRQTTNQLLKDLEALGLIKLAYGEVEILDAAALRALASI